ncbi:hypothetical protein CC2G_011279 [Coprinopsis cinerea AmutBmut pab1-1]|nr:hypothetical protein CC2G_011279 [Coprinopsis cinerea AmutBmut pab1-1]
MIESPIFDPITGFGGDGIPGTYTLPPDPQNRTGIPDPSTWKGCVMDGPFNATAWKINLGPGSVHHGYGKPAGLPGKTRPGTGTGPQIGTLRQTRTREAGSHGFGVQKW